MIHSLESPRLVGADVLLGSHCEEMNPTQLHRDFNTVTMK